MRLTWKKSCLPENEPESGAETDPVFGELAMLRRISPGHVAKSPRVVAGDFERLLATVDWRGIAKHDLDVILEFGAAADVASHALQKIALEMWAKEKGWLAKAKAKAAIAEAEALSVYAKLKEDGKAELSQLQERFTSAELSLKRERDEALSNLVKAVEDNSRLEHNSKRAKTSHTKAQKERSEKIKGLEKQLAELVGHY